MAVGNRHLGYKETLNALEARSPGTKASFYLTFLDNMAPLLAARRGEVVETLGRCECCGAPTTASRCAFCRIVERAAGHERVPVELAAKAGRRK